MMNTPLKRPRSRFTTLPNKQSGPTKPSASGSGDPRSKGKNSQALYEKYTSLAHEAMTTGDRVLAENHYQHADHYLRLINELKVNTPVIHPGEIASFAREEIGGGADFEAMIEEELGIAQHRIQKKKNANEKAIIH